MSFTFSVAMKAVTSTILELFWKLLYCGLSWRRTSVWHLHIYCVKIEAQRWVKFRAVMKPVSAKKKFYLCKFLIVNTTW